MALSLWNVSRFGIHQMLRHTLVAIMTVCAVSTAQAASMKEMQGAWVEEGFDCADTFVVDGDAVAYKDKGSMLNTGIIIRGSRIEGPIATCTAEQFKPEGDHVLTVQMSCSSHIMSGGIATSFRIIDAEHFEHFENAFPEIAVRYKLCHR